MGSIRIYKGMPPLTEEEIAELERNKPKSDDEIDYSDIPPTTDEEFKRFFKINPRTPEQWEQYYKYCPKHVQERHEKQRKLYGRAII